MITGLIMSSEYEHLAIVAYLLENNASIDRVDDYGNTALHFAAQFNEKNTDVVELLLKHPSMTIDIINKQNKGGYTALDYAYANETKIKSRDITRYHNIPSGKGDIFKKYYCRRKL